MTDDELREKILATTFDDNLVAEWFRGLTERPLIIPLPTVRVRSVSRDPGSEDRDRRSA